MIKIEELRIGNWVNFIDDSVDFMVVSITGFDSPKTVNGLMPEWIQPIIITEERLILFGFIKGFDKKGEPYYNHYTPCGKAFLYINGYCRFVETFIETPISYFHQLQNLYFALAGEELKLK